MTVKEPVFRTTRSSSGRPLKARSIRCRQASKTILVCRPESSGMRGIGGGGGIVGGKAGGMVLRTSSRYCSSDIEAPGRTVSGPLWGMIPIFRDDPKSSVRWFRACRLSGIRHLSYLFHVDGDCVVSERIRVNGGLRVDADPHHVRRDVGPVQYRGERPLGDRVLLAGLRPGRPLDGRQRHHFIAGPKPVAHEAIPTISFWLR